MNSEEFREYLETKTDKISELKNNEILNQLNISMDEFIDILCTTLSDEEKVQFLTDFTIVSVTYRIKVIQSINSNDLKLITIKNEELDIFYIIKIVKESTDDLKNAFIYDRQFLKELQLSKDEIIQIIGSMSDILIEELLKDKNYIIELFGNEDSLNYITEIILNIQDESKRFEVADEYDLDENAIAKIVSGCSDEKKKEILLGNRYDFNRVDIIQILSQFSISNLLEFLENEQYIEDKGIKIYEIVLGLTKEKQLEFAYKIDSININRAEKLKAIAVLDKDVKNQIDRSKLSEEYAGAIEMPVMDGKIEVDLDGDLNIYEGYDDLISTIRPQEIPFEKHDKLMQLAKICPNIRVGDNIKVGISTGHEFLSAEEWINDILKEIQEEWSDIQKIAYIDYKIGKKMSYTPDVGTEVEDENKERALWKIIDSGYGVCNGIAQVEQYILEHIGISSEIISSGQHSFLKISNIEIPRKDGTTIIGDTIIDPTWNLAAHRFDAYPNSLARSYSEIRKLDIADNGEDLECHRNDEALSSATVDIEESVLRQVYASLGLAKTNGDFPIADMMKESDEIAKKSITLEQKTAEQLELLQRMHPDFCKCQNSTMAILSGNILNHPEMNYRRLVVNRVYKKDDIEKKPVVYVYYEFEDEECFFVADPSDGFFSKIDKKSFIDKYECYMQDLNKMKGQRPWEKGAIEEVQDLTRSSGTIESQEKVQGDER